YLPDESSPRQLLPKPASLDRVDLPPGQLQFTQEWTIEEFESDAMPGVYDQLLRELYGPQKRIHRLGGHPQTIQGEMRLGLQMVTNGIPCGNPEAYQD